MATLDLAAAASAGVATDTLAPTNEIPADIRASLSPAQLADLTRLLAQRPTEHAFAYRVSTSFFGQPIYLALFSGVEQRSPMRVTSAGQRRSQVNLLVKAGLVYLIVSAVLVTGAAMLYVLKSSLGLDLFDGPSFMHRFFFQC